MSENTHDIEDVFHDPIEGHENMSPERVWDSIDHKLDKSNAERANKKYNRLKRLTAVLLLFLLGTIVYEIRSKTHHPEEKPIAVNGKVKIPTVIPASVAKRDVIKSDKIKENTNAQNPLTLNRQDKSSHGTDGIIQAPGVKVNTGFNNPVSNASDDHNRC